jgi:hypothetical protein
MPSGNFVIILTLAKHGHCMNLRSPHLDFLLLNLYYRMASTGSSDKLSFASLIHVGI